MSVFELDLRAGSRELGLRLLALALASAGIHASAIELWLALGLQGLALLVYLRSLRLAAQRPERLRLHPDGGVEAIVGGSAQAAELLQAGHHGPWPFLRFASGGRQHALMLFGDRLDAETAHRLRVWLATHPALAAPASARAEGLR